MCLFSNWTFKYCYLIRTVLFISEEIALRGHRLGCRLYLVVSLIHGRGTRAHRGSYIVGSLALARPCLGLFPLIAPTFLFSSFHSTLSLFCLLFPLFPCAKYPVWDTCTLRAWNPRSLQSTLDGIPCISGRIGLNGRNRCYLTAEWVDHQRNKNSEETG